MRGWDVGGKSAGLEYEADRAKTPGRPTLVDAHTSRGSVVPTTPGKHSLVPDAADPFESVVADATRYAAELEGALEISDRAMATQAAASLQSALGMVRETIGTARPDQAAAHLHAALELISHAEPLLAMVRGVGTSAADIAARGTSGAALSIPHLDRIQPAFGRHHVSQVRAAVDDAAAVASRELGAIAFAHKNSIAFASAPDLHTAAHEAAHVVHQQRRFRNNRDCTCKLRPLSPHGPSHPIRPRQGRRERFIVSTISRVRSAMHFQ